MTAMVPLKVGDGWEFTHPDGPLLTVDQLAPSKGVLYGWVELRWENGTSTRLLSAATRNLMGPTTASSLAKDASVGSPHDTAWWQPLLTEALHFVVTQHREGRPTVDLNQAGDAGFSWILRPVIETGGHTRLIAAGGAGKSFLVLAVAISVAAGLEGPFGTVPTVSGPVVYLDWETQDEGRTHGYRLRAVARGMGVSVADGMVLHQQHDLPLAERASSVAKLVDRVDSPLVVVDSNTMARGSGGRAGFEAATTDFLAALRVIGRPALIIDHKTKESIDKRKLGGYGSIHNENQVRMQWEYTRVHPQGDDVTRVLLENTKQNNVAPQEPIGLEVAFDNDYSNPDRPHLDAVRFDLIAAPTVRGVHPGAEMGGSVAEQLVAWMLDHGPATVAEAIAATGADRTTVQKALTKDGRFRKGGHAGRAQVWKLVDGAEATLELDDDDDAGGTSEVTGEPTEVPW